MTRCSVVLWALVDWGSRHHPWPSTPRPPRVRQGFCRIMGMSRCKKMRKRKKQGEQCPARADRSGRCPACIHRLCFLSTSGTGSECIGETGISASPPLERGRWTVYVVGSGRGGLTIEPEAAPPWQIPGSRCGLPHDDSAPHPCCHADFQTLEHRARARQPNSAPCEFRGQGAWRKRGQGGCVAVASLPSQTFLTMESFTTRPFDCQTAPAELKYDNCGHALVRRGAGASTKRDDRLPNRLDSPRQTDRTAGGQQSPDGGRLSARRSLGDSKVRYLMVGRLTTFPIMPTSGHGVAELPPLGLSAPVEAQPVQGGIALLSRRGK